MQPLILPKQSQAVLDGSVFQRAWYLYLTTLQDYAASGAGLAQHGLRAARLLLDIGSLVDGTLFVETDTGLLYQWRAASLAWSFVAGTQIADLTLTVASTTLNIGSGITSTGAVELVVILRQDGTGGRAVVWGAAFSGASVSLGAATASTISTFRFVKSPTTGKYVQQGQQTTDMTP